MKISISKFYAKKKTLPSI